MGAWGVGPFDCDTAADFAAGVRKASDTEARQDILLMAMRSLVQATDLTLHSMADYELESDVERAVAAVAFIADAIRERSHWTDTSFARGCKDTPPYDLLDPVDIGTVTDVLWISAMAVLDKVAHLLAADDSTGELSADAYRKVLAELREDLRHREPSDQ